MENPLKLDDLGVKNPYFWVQHPNRQCLYQQASIDLFHEDGSFSKLLLYQDPPCRPHPPFIPGLRAVPAMVEHLWDESFT